MKTSKIINLIRLPVPTFVREHLSKEPEETNKLGEKIGGQTEKQLALMLDLNRLDDSPMFGRPNNRLRMLDE